GQALARRRRPAQPPVALDILAPPWPGRDCSVCAPGGRPMVPRTGAGPSDALGIDCLEYCLEPAATAVSCGNLLPRNTATGEPSARKAERGGAPRKRANGAPYNPSTSQSSEARRTAHTRQGRCVTWYSRQPPSRCVV